MGVLFVDYHNARLFFELEIIIEKGNRMNTFFKLFIIKTKEMKSILLYGYGMLDTGEVREWKSGQISKKLKLYKLTCVLDEENVKKFEDSLLGEEEIIIADNFRIHPGFIKRPEIIALPKQEWGVNNGSIIKTLSTVIEFWNLNKVLLVQELQDIFADEEARKQREMIHDVLAELSNETGLCFLEDSSERLGNIEIYIPGKWASKFNYGINKESDNNTGNIKIKNVYIRNKDTIDFDVLVHCILKNSERCILNQIKEMKSEISEIQFEPAEPVSEVFVEIWNKENGELIYVSGAPIMRQLVLKTSLKNNTRFIFNDQWTDKLEKTFGGNKEKNKKLNEVKTVKYEYAPMVSKIGNFKDDPWHEAASLGKRLIEPYKYDQIKGAFCKKKNGGEGEIDSYFKIMEYLNQSLVKNVIIFDPYFSIISIQKILSRITNIKLKLEIITSLKKKDSDKNINTKEAKDEESVDKAKSFLNKNANIIHQSLRIINVTHNGKTAIHDRYLLRMFEDGRIDGFLLSNSLNSAGQNFSFVVAPMDTEVTYDVLEYVNEIKNSVMQRNKPKNERLQCEILWDTLESKYEKETTELVLIKKWELDMKKNYSNNEFLDLNSLFYDGWNFVKEIAEECILKISWYLYYSVVYSVEDLINYWKKQNFNIDNILQMCVQLAIKLEKEEEQYEELNLNKKNSELYIYRSALYIEKREQVKIYPKILMRDGIHVFYKINGFVSTLYEVIYELSHKELVGIMEKAHSPMAMEILWQKIYSNNSVDFELYQKMLSSNLVWVREWAMFNFSEKLINNIKANKDSTDIDNNFFENNKTISIYQYANCIEEIAFEIHYSKNNSKTDLEYIQRLETIKKEIIKKEGTLLSEDLDINQNMFFSLLNSSNKEVYCKIVANILNEVNNTKKEKILLWQLINLMNDKWKNEEITFYKEDFIITSYAAQASFYYWNNNIEDIFRELQINEKNLYKAIEPGIKDIHYSEWNNAVLKVLWQLLYLINYLEILKENQSNNLNDIQKICNKINTLSKIKNQCEDWFDSCGLANAVFSNLNKVV